MNLRFSQRMGKTPAKKAMQIASMDEDLRNGLWNVFKASIIEGKPKFKSKFQTVSAFDSLCMFLWHTFYKLPIDRIPEYDYQAEDFIRIRFFKAQWYEVYDLLEFIISADFPADEIDTYKENCNNVLEREFAGYRFIGDNIAPITNTHEAREIENALDLSESFTALMGVNIHLKAALAHLSNKQAPDYRNSIKESISAIESLAKTISGNLKDTLGAALDKIKGKIKLHQALEKGFKQIYGYTSDSSGIRHALTEAPDCDFEDAAYMLVSCSAFINYLIVKSEKAGITF